MEHALPPSLPQGVHLMDIEARCFVEILGRGGYESGINQ